MNAVPLIALAAFAIAVVCLPFYMRWDTRRRQRRDPRYRAPVGLGVFDELYHPDVHASSQIIEEERRAPARAFLPGDPDEPGPKRRLES